MNEPNIIVYAADWCSDCWHTKRFLRKHRVPYEWVDIDHDPEGRAYVERVNNGNRSVPTIVFADGSILVEPTNAELAAKLGLA